MRLCASGEARIPNVGSPIAAHLAFMRYGVGTAQRGRLTAVINTWQLQRLRTFLRKGR